MRWRETVPFRLQSASDMCCIFVFVVCTLIIKQHQTQKEEEKNHSKESSPGIERRSGKRTRSYYAHLCIRSIDYELWLF